MTNTRYTIEHVYLVTCNDCKKGIGRTLTDKYPTSRDELKQLLDYHNDRYHADTTKPKKVRGLCSVCNAEFALNVDGTMRRHYSGSGLFCEGYGKPPKETA